MKRQNKKIRITVLTALFAAMTAALTFYVKIPVHTGYLHIGDSVIYLAACLLPAPAAMLCGALGGCLADALGGYTVYIIPTLIIKGSLALAFSRRTKKIVAKRNIIALIICAAITAVGYFFADAVILAVSESSSFDLFKSIIFSPVPWTAATYGLAGNLIQSAASSALFIALGTALDKIKFKNRLEEI